MDNIKQLIGKTIKKVEGLDIDSELVQILLTDGTRVEFLHHQDCCEHVYLHDFELTAKSVDKLEGAVINDARADSSDYESDPDSYDDSGTWTFYNINTSKGCINMRWLGTSNGYYSEGVSIDFYA